MANMKRRVHMTAAILMAVSLAACSGASSGGQADTGEEEQVDNRTDDEILDDYADSIEDTLKDHYGENYKVERDGLFVNASVWKDGSAKIVEDAVSGDEAQREQWEKELSELKEFSEELGISMEATGVKNGHVVLSLMDEENQQRMLAMLSDGVVIFDEVSASEETEAAESEDAAAEESTEEPAESGDAESESE